MNFTFLRRNVDYKTLYFTFVFTFVKYKSPPKISANFFLYTNFFLLSSTLPYHIPFTLPYILFLFFLREICANLLFYSTNYNFHRIFLLLFLKILLSFFLFFLLSHLALFYLYFYNYN